MVVCSYMLPMGSMKNRKAHWSIVIKVDKVIEIMRIDKTTFSSVRALTIHVLLYQSKFKRSRMKYVLTNSN